MHQIINIDFKSHLSISERAKQGRNYLKTVATDSKSEDYKPAWAVFEIRHVVGDDELRTVGTFETEMSADAKVEELRRAHRRIINETKAIGPRHEDVYGQTIDIYFSEEMHAIFGYHAYKVKTRIIR